MKWYGILVGVIASPLVQAQGFEVGDEPRFSPERKIEQPNIEPSRPGQTELTMAYRRDAAEQSRARAQAEEREIARYRDMPTREEAEAEGESYWDRQENLRKEQERRLTIERSTRAQKLSQQYYYETMPGERAALQKEELEQAQAARKAKEKAYEAYYANLSAQERASEEAKYEQKLQEFEQMTNQAYEEAVRTIEQEKRAAQALNNILRSAQMQAQFEEQTAQIAIAAEKAARTAAFLENVMRMSEQESERSARVSAAQAAEREREGEYQTEIRTPRTQAFLEDLIQMSERESEWASRIAAAQEKEQELERAYQAAREAEVALERIIRSADYEARFNDAIRRDIERNEQQLEEVRLKIKKKTEALRLQIQFEEASAKFNENWQKAQQEINESYAQKAVHQLENLRHTILNLKKNIIDPALQQAADRVANSVSRASQAVSHNRAWKEQAQQAAVQAQIWMTQARAWVSAQTGFVAKLPGKLNAWMAAHAGVVGPHAGRDITLKMRGQTEIFAPETKKIASALANNYRQTVKAFDNRKKFKNQSNYPAILQYLVFNFNEIKKQIETWPDASLKRAVTTAVVPLLVRKWKGENVIFEYIDDYLKKLEYELGNVTFQSQFQRPSKFGSLIGSGA